MLTVYNSRQIFVASCTAIAVIGLTFAVRADIIGDLSVHFHLSHHELGWISGAAFWGYLISIIIGGHLCESVGMGWLLASACLLHVAGILLTISAVGFWSLWLATLIIGIANALIEAVVNPLVVTIYPDEKTSKLNLVHAWFSWGIVIGGLAAFGLTAVHRSWQFKMAMLLVPCLAYGLAYLGQKFPATERRQHGVTTAEMYSEVTRPAFLVWVGCMLLTASTELGPNQWIPNILTNIAGFVAILLLVWINSIMAIGRLATGLVLHWLSPVGMLIASAVLASAGLAVLGVAQSSLLQSEGLLCSQLAYATFGRPCWRLRRRGSPVAGSRDFEG